jgi:hypothetical protein
MRAVRPGVKEAQAQDSLVAAVSGSTGLPLGPRDQKWDASAADKTVRTWAGAEDAPNAKYGQAFFLKDDVGSKFGDYRLGFAQPDGDTLKANWGGITAVAGVLQGARGGIKDVSDADLAKVKSRVEGYYAAAKKAYGDDSIEVPWAGDGAAAAHNLAYAEQGGENPELLTMATAIWEQEFAVAAPDAAKPGDLVWDDEEGFADLSDDLQQLLNAGGWGWCVLDVALSADKAIACNYRDDDGEYVGESLDDDDDDGPSCWLIPFTIGDDKEPVLSDQAAWSPIEKGWVKQAAALSARFAARFAVLAPCDNCDHPAGMHGGDGNDGACSSPDCECGSYTTASNAGVTSFQPYFQSNTGNSVTMTFTGVDGTAFADAINATLPDAHKPGEKLPRRRATVKAPEAQAAAGPTEWSAILAPEGKLTSDGRAFAPGSITWPRLDDGPLALMAMTVTSEGGHVGAELCGQIQKIWRDEVAGLIRASGVFDSGEYGTEIARLVDDRTLRGVSVDLAVQKWDRSPSTDWFNEDGEWAPKPDADREQVSPLDLLYGEDLISVVLAAEIGMTTVCPFPAFGEAQIAVGDSLVAAVQSEMCWTVTSDAGWFAKPSGAAVSASTVPGEDCGCDDAEPALTASAAGLVTDAPPASWFDNPDLDGPTPLTVDDEGRVSGHAAVWEINGSPACHIGLPGRCVSPPHTNTDYAFFHLGEVLCEGGERVPCGQITLDTGHADRDLRSADATRHYDHTGTVAAHVVCGEDEHGIWVAGALQPDAPAEKVALLRGAKLSGDWRQIDGNLELVALLAVNVPGFPVPYSRHLVASGDDGEMHVVALLAAGIPVFDEELSAVELERFRALAAHAEFAELARQAA